MSGPTDRETANKDLHRALMMGGGGGGVREGGGAEGGGRGLLVCKGPEKAQLNVKWLSSPQVFYA